MKKILSLVVLLGLTLGVVLTGCSKSEAPPATPAAPATNAPAP